MIIVGEKMYGRLGCVVGFLNFEVRDSNRKLLFGLECFWLLIKIVIGKCLIIRMDVLYYSKFRVVMDLCFDCFFLI